VRVRVCVCGGGAPLRARAQAACGVFAQGGRTPAIRCDPTTTEGCNEQEKVSSKASYLCAPSAARLDVSHAQTYIDKVVRSFSPSDRTTELARLKKVCALCACVCMRAREVCADCAWALRQMDTASATKGMKPDVLSWLRRRITILEKLGAAEAKAAEL
jgi:hypothetical protein